ncbi:MAG: hypothetical protein GOU99_02100, partial [Candidatus Altiarchaeota archaeon]|nr:hypothetical protein [Candidatus Altiarchaeota archaeon]
MKLILVPKKDRLDALVKHAEKLFGKSLNYVVYPKNADDANMILFEKGLRRTAETINAQRVKDGL